MEDTQNGDDVELTDEHESPITRGVSMWYGAGAGAGVTSLLHYVAPETVVFAPAIFIVVAVVVEQYHRRTKTGTHA